MLTTCPECGAQVSDRAPSCPSCGFPFSRSEPEETVARKRARPVSAAAQSLIAIGALGMIVAPFLPWVRLGVLSASGIDKTGGEALLVSVCGALALISVIASFAKGTDRMGWVPFLFSLVGGGLSFFYYSAATTQLSDLQGALLTPTIGSGPYVAIASAGLVFLGVLGTLRLK